MALTGSLAVIQVSQAPPAQAKEVGSGGMQGSTVTGGGAGQAITDTTYGGAKLTVSSPTILFNQQASGRFVPQTGRTNPAYGTGASFFLSSWGTPAGAPQGMVWAQPTAWNHALPYTEANNGPVVVPSSLTNDGVFHNIMQFTVSFDPPIANPVINAANAGWIYGTGSNSYSQPFGKLQLTGARGANGGAVSARMSKLSGFGAPAPYSVNAAGNALTCDIDTRNAQGMDRYDIPYTGGTLRFDTGGQPVSSMTFVSADSWAVANFYQVYGTNWGFQLQAPEEVSALNRWIGTYDHATHLMPRAGNDNLHLGNTIAEGNRNSFTFRTNSGAAGDNSDAGYDGLAALYFADDPARTPVTQVYASDAGRRLETQVRVSGADSATAYVRGFIDFGRTGSFPASGASSVATVPGGNGTATLQWTVPNSVSSGDLPIRLRTAYDQNQISSAFGAATSGEVEDYQGRLAGGGAGSRNNLKMVKTISSGATARPGETVTYQLWVNNLNGQPSTSAVTVTDALPSQLENVTIALPPTTGSAAIAGNTLTWTLPAGVSSNVGMQVTGRVKAGSAQGDMTNTAQLSGLCDTANCTASVTSRISGSPAALKIEKSGPATAASGGTIQWQLTATNNGEMATGTGVIVTDNLPTQLQSGATTATGDGSATVSGSTVIWHLPANIPAGGQVKLTISSRLILGLATGTTVTNRATITSGPCTGGDCLAQTSTLITATSSRLSLTQTAPTATIFPGDTGTYTYTVTNSGSSPLRDVEVTDSTPIFSADPIQCAGSGTSRIATLNAGQSVTCTLRHTFTDDEFMLGHVGWQLNGLTNYGSVQGWDPDGVPVTADANSNTKFDIHFTGSLKKAAISVNPDPVRAGSLVQYKADLAYTGDGGMRWAWFIDSRVPRDEWTCTPPVDPDIPHGYTSTCTASYRVTEQDIRDNWASGQITNNAMFSGTNTLWQNQNLTLFGRADVPVDKTVPKVRLEGTVTVNQPTAEPGDTVTFTITAKNTGQLTATSAEVLNSLKGATPAPIPAANCTWPGTVGELAPDAQVTCQVPYTVLPADAGTTIVDRATATAMDGTDPVGPVSLGEAQVQVGSGVNMSATKVNSLTPGARVKPGDQFSYTITLKNDGTAPARGVTLTDQLPDGLEFFPVSQPGWTFAGSVAKSGPVDVPAGGSVPLTFQVRVAAGTLGGTVLKNVAAIDGMATTAECDADATKAGCAVDLFPPTVDDSNITITKTNSLAGTPPQVKVGDTFSYTLVVRNTGVSPANGFTITDELPAGLEFYPVPQSGWTFTGNTAKSLSFNLAGNSTLTLHLNVRVAAGASGVLRNVSAVDGVRVPADCAADPTLTGCGVDPNPPTVVDHSGIKMAKSNDVTTVGKRVRVGDTFSYTVTAQNQGATPAAGVKISDTLPAGLVFDGPQEAKWTITGNTATWTTDIGVGETVSGVLKVRVVVGATGTLRNVAVMDDQDPAQCNVTPVPNACGVDPDPPTVDNTRLTITKANSVASGIVHPGDSYTYQFTVSNTGLEAATGVVITDQLQSDVTFSPDPQAGWTAAGQLVTSDPFDVGPNSVRQVSFTVKVNDNAAGGTIIRNTGIIRDLADQATCTANPAAQGCGTDPRPLVVDDSSITITKENSLSGTPPQVKAGDTFYYTLVVRNSGTSAASNVRIVDQLPAGLEFFPTPQSLWTFSGQQAQSAAFNMPGNSSQTLVLRVRVTAGATGELKNVSAVSGMATPAECAADATKPGCGVDPNPPTVVDHSGVTISKVNDVTTPGKRVVVGQSYTYTVTVANRGATDAVGVVVSDTLPAGLAFDGPQNTVWSITGSTARATVDIPAGVTRTYDLKVRVAPGATGTLRNVSVLDDQDPAQCLAPGTPSPRCGVDPEPPVVDNTRLSITKANSLGAGARVKPGQTYTYTFTIRNQGTEPASGIVVTDELPASLELNPAAQPGWTLSGTTLSSAPQAIAANGSQVLTLTVRVKADAVGGTVIRNTGIIDGMATPADCAATPSMAGCGVDPFPPTVDDSNITITKRNTVTGTPKTVKVGDTFSYMLEVRNNGTSPASNVRITDQLPAGLVFFPVTQGGWTFTGNTATSFSFNLGGNDMVTFMLSVQVAPGATGTLVNVSTTGPSTPAECAADPAKPGCGVDPDPPSVLDHSAISIAKANDVSTAGKKVRVGDVFHYAIKVTNPTSAVIPKVEIGDTLPAGLVLNGTQSAPWTVTGTNRVSAVVDVPANSTQTYDIYVRVAEGASGTLRNVAVMDDRLPAACLADPALQGCAVDPEPPSVVAALVQVTKTNNVITALDRFVFPGQPYTYTITATNTSATAPATGITLSDTLHAALEFPAGTQTDWVLTGNTAQTVPFDLAPGASRTFTLNVRVKLDAAAGTRIDNAVVQDGGPSPSQCLATPAQAGCGVDPRPPTVSIDIIQPTKKSSVPPGQAAHVGDVIEYTIDVFNAGYRNATDIVLLDRLPDGLVVDPNPQAGWVVTGNMVRSTPFDLAIGEHKTLTMLTRAMTDQSDPSRNVVITETFKLAAMRLPAPAVNGNQRLFAPSPAVTLPEQAVTGGATIAECEKGVSLLGCAYADVQILPALPSPSATSGTSPSASPSASTGDRVAETPGAGNAGSGDRVAETPGAGNAGSGDRAIETPGAGNAGSADRATPAPGNGSASKATPAPTPTPATRSSGTSSLSSIASALWRLFGW